MTARRNSYKGIGPFVENITFGDLLFQDVPGLTGDPAVELLYIEVTNNDDTNAMEYQIESNNGATLIPSNGLGNGSYIEPIPDGLSLVVDEASGAVQVRAVALPCSCTVRWWIMPAAQIQYPAAA